MNYVVKHCFSEEMLKDAKCVNEHLHEMIDTLKEKDLRYFSVTKCKFRMSRFVYYKISDTLRKAGYSYYVTYSDCRGYGADGYDRKIMGISVEFDDFEALSTDPANLIYDIELRYGYEPDHIYFDEFVINPKWYKKQVNAIFGKDNAMPEIKKVIFNDPATIVFWKDGTKTVVKCMEDETFDPEKGILVAMYKKMSGDKPNYFKEIKKWAKTYYDILPEDPIEKIKKWAKGE